MTTRSLERVETVRSDELKSGPHEDGSFAVVDTASHEVGLEYKPYEPDPLETHFGRPLPVQLIRRYAKLAAKRAESEKLEDGTWFASIRGFEGVWAEGESEEEALEAVEGVVRDWVCFKVIDKDRDLPVLDAINLNVL